VGNFNSGTDTLEVRGDFNSWNGGMTLSSVPGNPNVYQVTYTNYNYPPGTTLEYKFVMITQTAGYVWETVNNRVLTMPGSAQTLPVVYFNNLAAAPIRAEVLFQVDMGVQLTIGTFDRATGQVWVRGDSMGWDAPPSGLQLFEDTARPGVYTNVFAMEQLLPGVPIAYKFTTWQPATSTTVWEDDGNKQVVFTGAEPVNAAGYYVETVGPVYFNGLGYADVLTQETLVTFTVNMNGAVGVGGSPVFTEGTDWVDMNGDFLGWWTWGSPPAAAAMYDDGMTGGDTVAQNGIWSLQYLFPKGSRTRVEYAYSIDASPNEGGYGANHVRYIRSTGSYAMPMDTFGVMVQEPITNALLLPESLLRLVIPPPPLNAGHRLTFSLDPGAPAGASINPSTGQFRWTPTRQQAATTVLITIRITDNDVPTLSTLETLVAVVEDYLDLGVGWTGAQAGQSATLPITLASSSGVTNLVFTLGWRPDYFSNPSLGNLAPGIASATLEDQTTSLLITVQTAAGQALLGTNQILQLNFQVAGNQPSAFADVPVQSVSGVGGGNFTYSHYITHAGYVGVVNQQPLLRALLAADQSRSLVVFGKVGFTSVLQASPTVSGGPWTTAQSFAQTSVAQTVALGSGPPVVFYRLLQR
jgi:hypothetical protein